MLSYTYGFGENGVVKQKTYKSNGYLGDLQKTFENPVTHFKNECKRLYSDFKPDELAIITINTNQTFDKLSLKYHILLVLYFFSAFIKNLKLMNFIKKHQSEFKFNFNLNNIFQTLIYSQILGRGCKKYIIDSKNQFMNNFDLSFNDLYRSLDVLDSLRVPFSNFIHTELEKFSSEGLLQDRTHNGVITYND